MPAFDIAVIGAGIAGLSAAAEASQAAKIVVLERESQPGYHATGRSAAVFFETYGSEAIRALTRASRPFFEAPAEGFARPLIETCGALFIARADQLQSLEAFAAEEDVRATGRRISQREALSLCPVLKPDYVAEGLYDPAPASIDVAALLDGYRRMFLARGGSLLSNAAVTQISFANGLWRIATPADEIEARILVNAAGAWADDIAKLAGVAPVGLEPRRRTAVVVRADGAQALATRALIIDVDEQFYFRSESGDVFVSPADETLSAPCDAQPEELDVAVAIDRLSTATTLTIRGVRAKWAGLRSFVADRNPVVGFDRTQPQFFWLAAQGGYGLQTAPAMASLGASLLLDRPLASSLAGIARYGEALSPARFA